MCWGLTKPLPSDVQYSYHVRHYRGRRHYNVRRSSHVDTYGHLVVQVLCFLKLPTNGADKTRWDGGRIKVQQMKYHKRDIGHPRIAGKSTRHV